MKAVVLIGHGGVPSDAPRNLVPRLRALEAQRRASGDPVSATELELDRTVRSWPRTDETDPYRAGLEAVAERLRSRLGADRGAAGGGDRVVTAYNEFCAPSIPGAVDALVADGVTDVTLVTTMLTPGGVHSEVEIPEIVSELRERHPAVRITYAWPFNLDLVAGLLADQVRAAL